MNAHQLADELHLISSQRKDLLDKSVVLIRQQAEQIADQETTIKFLQEECAALREQLNEVSN